MAEGRLNEEELDQRLDALYAARTYSDLDVLLADLPANRPLKRVRVRPGRLVGAVSAVSFVVMMLGVLVILRGRSAAGVFGTGHQRRLILPDPLAGPHEGLIIAATLVAASVMVLTSAALLWALTDSGSVLRSELRARSVSGTATGRR
jgi:hypothetical protein